MGDDEVDRGAVISGEAAHFSMQIAEPFALRGGLKVIDQIAEGHGYKCEPKKETADFLEARFA